MSNAPTYDSFDGHLMKLEIWIPVYSVSSDCVNMDRLFEFCDLNLGAGYGWVVKSGNKVYKKSHKKHILYSQ